MNDIKLIPKKNDPKKEGESGFRLSSNGISGKSVSENISRLSKGITLNSGFLLWPAVIFLLAAVLVCLGLFGYKMSLDKQKNGLIQKIDELNQTRDVAFEKNLMDLKDKIDSLKNILSNQAYSSDVFTLLEELVVPQVYFVSLSSDLAKMSISLNTMAFNVDSLVKQLVVFKNDSRIKKASLNSVSTDNSGQVNSAIELQLKSSILYPKQ